MKQSLLLILSIFLLFSLSSCIKKKKVDPHEKTGSFVMIGKLDSWRSNNPPPFHFSVTISINYVGVLYNDYRYTVGKGVTDSLGNFQIICDYYPKPAFYSHRYTMDPSVTHMSKINITDSFTHPAEPNDTVYVNPIHLFK